MSDSPVSDSTPATAAGRGSIAYEPCPQDGHPHDWRDCPTPEEWATTTAATVERRDVNCAAEFYVRLKDGLTSVFPCVLSSRHTRHMDSTGRTWEGDMPMDKFSVAGYSNGRQS